MSEITKLRESHFSSERYKMAETGQRYYRSKNDITQRKMYIWRESGLVEDVYKANNKIPSAYSKLLIDQLVNYLLGKNPNMPDNTPDEFTEKLKDYATSARAQGVAWVVGYVKDGELKLKQIPTVELLPVYEDGELVKMYRFITKDDKEYTYEYTTTQIITYDEKGNKINEKGNLRFSVTAGSEETIEDSSLDMVPFIPLKANAAGIYDLEPIKPLIDSYDLTISDFANNLEDFQDVTWILKGYTGKNVSEFIDQVKKFKSIPVGEGGEARPETIDIPHEARMQMLEKCENLIFKFGFGVNLDALSGGSLTNVAIKSQFSNLDMKANAFSQEVTKFIDRYVKLYNSYADQVNGEKIEEDYEIKYNKTLIINEEEAIQANITQYNFVSEETRLKNHPWVTDVEEEQRLMGERVTLEE